MAILFICLGILSLIFGLIYLFLPRWIIKISRTANIIISTDHHLLQHRTISGVLLILASLLMFYVSAQFWH